MESMIEFVHQRIKKHKYQNGIDFTMGNGHDTLFLSDYCHHVYSYDIQSLALNNTKEFVKRKKNITLFLKSHEYFDEDVRNFEVGIFNLGYLPGGNHECVTQYETTLKTIKKALEHLVKGGCLYVVVYIVYDLKYENMHPNLYFLSLDHVQYNVAKFEMMNKNNSPYVVIIEKR